MGWAPSGIPAAVVGIALAGCSVGTASRQPDAHAASVQKQGPNAQIVRAEDREAVNTLDSLLSQRWSDAEVPVAPPVDDHGYLRRVTLDLVGRVPSPEEIERFFDMPEEDRRERRVSELLGSEEHADYWAWRLYDLLFDERVQEAPRMTSPARIWLRDELAANRPWDAIVWKLLTSNGELEYEPATSYVIAHVQISGLEGLTTAVSDRLLGVQLACAQCHDHPYDDWTRRDFWGMAAGLAGARVRAEAVDPKFTRLHLEEGTSGEGRIAAELGTQAKATPAPSLMGQPVTVREGESRREAIARAIIGSDLLAKAAVARVWTDLFGRGLHEPWNDLGGPGRTHEPELEHLAATFRESGYDLRRMLQVITTSEAYARSATGPEDGRDAAAQTFARAQVRPLNSHQVYHSLVRVTGLDNVPPPIFLFVAHSLDDHLRRRYERVFDDGCTRGLEHSRVELAQSLAVLNDGVAHFGSQARYGLALANIVATQPDASRRTRAVYLRVLGREPTADEMERAARLVKEVGDPDAHEDLMYALLNSAEFLTNH